MTTWLQFKTAVFNLMDLDSTEYSDYLDKIYDAANYTFMEIADRVQPILAKYEFTQRNLVNLLAVTSGKHSDEDIIFTATNPKGYYFETNGTGTCTVKADGVDVSTITLSGSGYQAYKGIISNTGSISLVFSGDYTYPIRNVALYEALFSADPDDIPSNSMYTSYDMSSLGTRFLGFDELTPVVIQKNDDGTYSSAEYYIEKKTIYVKTDQEGEFVIYYKQYPTEITSSTADSFTIELEPDVIQIAQLLCASRLFFTDGDTQNYVLLYNQYEQAKDGIVREFSSSQGITVSGGLDV